MVFHFISLLALALGSRHSPKDRIGTIEFFGTQGIDVPKVRSMLPVREGDEVSEDQAPGIRDQISQAITSALGHPPTDISLICCNDQQKITIYIGLGGSNTASVSLLSATEGLDPPSQGRACSLRSSYGCGRTSCRDR